MGCGAGTDLMRFAQSGANVTGIDLSSASVLLAKERLNLYKLKGDLVNCDAENIPYKDNTFDFVYSWGAIHHTPNPEKAISEIYRVTKSGGEICVMLYHRYSLVSLQMYLMFGLFALKPFRNIEDILAKHHESLGTKAYTVGEVCQMFSMLKDLKVDVRVTSYDLRYSRDKFLPMWVGKVIPQCFGWNIIVQGRKP